MSINLKNKSTIVKKFGADALPKFAKMHFKTAQEALKEAQK